MNFGIHVTRGRFATTDARFEISSAHRQDCLCHGLRRRLGARAVVCALAWLTLTAIAPSARAQQPPPGAIGRVEGLDVSVEGGTAAGGATTSAPSIYVTNGSVVTVHSGKAHMTLAAGGELDICGPAKFTLLQSGDAITVAVSFGRVHVRLPATTALRLFTPTIIATPLDINGGSRDVTVGLDVHDAMCVVASSGALRLEHQFSGENLVVPQLGEFFLEAGKLAPIAGSPGTCECEVTRAQVAVPPRAIPSPSAQPLALAPTMDANISTPPPSTSANSGTAPAAPVKAPPSSGWSVEFSVPAHANETHPVVPAAKNAELAPPPEYRPEYKVMMPPLTFTANAPPPPEPSLDTILLVRIARVQPVWEFTGKVEAPPLDGKNAKADAKTQAAGGNAGAAAATNQANQTPAVAGAQATPAPKPKGGFWAKLKHLFGGGTVEAAPKPCQGTGCS